MTLIDLKTRAQRYSALFVRGALAGAAVFCVIACCIMFGSLAFGVFGAFAGLVNVQNILLWLVGVLVGLPLIGWGLGRWIP